MSFVNFLGAVQTNEDFSSFKNSCLSLQRLDSPKTDVDNPFSMVIDTVTVADEFVPDHHQVQTRSFGTT